MTVYNATSAAEIITMVGIVGTPGSVVSPDTVLIDNGSFDTSAQVLLANPGVTVKGNGLALCTVLGIWANNSGGSSDAVVFEDFTIDLTGLAGGFVCDNGTYIGRRMKISGPNTAGVLFHMRSQNGPVISDWHDCIMQDAVGDVADSSGANEHGPASLTQLHNCTLSGAAAGAGNQLFSAHNGHVMKMHGGTLDDSARVGGTEKAATNGTGAGGIMTESFLHGVTVFGGVRNGVSCYDCHLTFRTGASSIVSSDDATSDTEYKRCIIDKTTTGYTCVVTGAAAMLFESCWIKGTQRGITSLLACGGAAITVRNCRFSGYTDAIHLDHNAANDVAMELTNNIFDSDIAEAIEDSTTGTMTWTGGHNVFGGTVDAIYTLQTGDVIEAPELDAQGVPRKDGNCDASRGDSSLRQGVGMLDLWGRRKLNAYADCIGPISPQYDRVGNTLHPVSRSAGEMT